MSSTLVQVGATAAATAVFVGAAYLWITQGAAIALDLAGILCL